MRARLTIWYSGVECLAPRPGTCWCLLLARSRHVAPTDGASFAAAQRGKAHCFVSIVIGQDANYVHQCEKALPQMRFHFRRLCIFQSQLVKQANTAASLLTALHTLLESSF